MQIQRDFHNKIFISKRSARCKYETSTVLVTKRNMCPHYEIFQKKTEFEKFVHIIFCSECKKSAACKFFLTIENISKNIYYVHQTEFPIFFLIFQICKLKALKRINLQC